MPALEPGTRVFVPFTLNVERAGNIGVIQEYSPKESKEQLEQRFANDPFAEPPIEYPRVEFGTTAHPDVELMENGHIEKFTWASYLGSLISARFPNMKNFLFPIAFVGLVALAAWAFSERYNVDAPRHETSEMFTLLGQKEAESILRRSALFSEQHNLKVRLFQNLQAVKKEDQILEGLKKEALRLINSTGSTVTSSGSAIRF